MSCPHSTPAGGPLAPTLCPKCTPALLRVSIRLTELLRELEGAERLHVSQLAVAQTYALAATCKALPLRMVPGHALPQGAIAELGLLVMTLFREQLGPDEDPLAIHPEWEAAVAILRARKGSPG